MKIHKDRHELASRLGNDGNRNKKVLDRAIMGLIAQLYFLATISLFCIIEYICEKNDSNVTLQDFAKYNSTNVGPSGI